MTAMFTILGAPRTKKNSGRRVYSFAQKRTFNVSSVALEEWAESAAKQLKAQRQHATITGPVHVRATFYREKNIGDLVGFMQALGDVLEAPKKTKSRRPPAKAAVILDDRQIVSWDGTRVAKDAKRPRVEVEITTMEMP